MDLDCLVRSLVLVVKCKVSFLYLGVVLLYFFFTATAGFGIHREYERQYK